MKQQGLFIGVNEYEKDSGLGSLKFAEKDADHISRIFSSRYGFEVDTLLGKAATQGGIEGALVNYQGGDLFVLFYAGHGGESHGQYKLFPSGASANGLGALDFRVLSDILQYNFGFRKILILLDACRNENRVYDNRRRASPGFYASRDIQAALVGESYVDIIYGCGEGQVSYEAEELGHGLFTYALSQVLANGPEQMHCSFLLTHSYPSSMNDEKFLLHRVCPNKLLRSHFLSTGLKFRRTYGIYYLLLFCDAQHKAWFSRLFYAHSPKDFTCFRSVKHNPISFQRT
ncbi:caspase family protein [Desulfobacter latus]|uniref:Caspase family protein n=1 Tax=Desulfobacter latus TaxID=2292 RepID=A0A850T726_9BACT|nr:caspase family protein [Desulfobacter latus]NWH04815.1 caspase family protein [Desulfobacter latus]